MKHKLFFLITALCITAAANWVQAAIVNVTPATYSVPHTGGTYLISIGSTSATLEVWNATKDAAWIKNLTTQGVASISSPGLCQFQVDANTSTNQRVGKITISGHTITVTQAGKPYMTGSESGPITLYAFANDYRAEYQTNINKSEISHTVNVPWLTITQCFFEGTVDYTCNLYYDVTPNTTPSQRQATITARGGGLSHTITILQPSIYYTISNNALSVTSAAVEKTISIQTNVYYKVTISALWLTVIPAKVRYYNSDNSLIVEISANPSYSARTATIKFEPEMNNGTKLPAYNKTITVTQAGATPVTYTVTFETNGGNTIANQTVNAGGTATRPPDPTRSGYTFAGWYSNSTLTTAYDFNTPVTANITLYAKWTANAPPPSLTVSTLSPLEFESVGGEKSFTITSNVANWTVSSSAPTWASVTPTSGSNNGTIKVTVLQNNTGVVRSANISISASGVTTQTVPVTQSNITVGNEIAEPSSLTAYAQNGVLYVSGLTAGRKWGVYNMLGQLICQGTATTNVETHGCASLPKRGMYVVTDGKTTLKIMNN